MITLRQYQKEAVNAGVRFFQNDRVSKPKMLIAPTAAGKSIIIAAIASELDGNVLVLQPSAELLKQNFEKYGVFADNGAIYSASANRREVGKVTFATIGTITKVPELFTEFKYLIIDEAHLYPPGEESMFGSFLAKNPQLKILGLTATPFRLQSSMNGSKLVMMHNSNIYNGYCHIIQIQDIAPQFWCKLKYIIDSGSQKVLKINSTGADYTEDSLALFGASVDDKIRHYVAKSAGFPKIVFVPTIAQAMALSQATPNSAAVSSKTPKSEREQIISDFKKGVIDTVFNVNILSVGFDYPELRIIIDAVPTMSLARHYQKVGRLTRQHPTKQIGAVVDLAGNTQMFGRVEDIEIRKIGTTYHVFSGQKQLTGVWFGDGFVPEIKEATEFEDVKITFGKFKGETITTAPKWWLSWAIDNIDHDKKLISNIKLFLKNADHKANNRHPV